MRSRASACVQEHGRARRRTSVRLRWNRGSPHAVEVETSPVRSHSRPSRVSTSSTAPQTPSLKPPTNLLTSFPDNGPLRAVLTPGSDGSAPPNTGGTGGLAKCGCRPLGSVLSKATHSWTEGEPLGDTRPPAGEEASWQLIVFLWVLCDSEEAS